MKNETYKEQKDRHQLETNSLPIFFAFSNKQLLEELNKIGLTLKDTDKIYKMPGGGFHKKTDSKIIKEMFDRHEAEFAESVKADKTGEGFIFEMFDYELGNHEYCYTYDVTDTLEYLGYTEEEILSNPALLNGLTLAKKAQREWAANNDI